MRQWGQGDIKQKPVFFRVRTTYIQEGKKMERARCKKLLDCSLQEI